MCWASDHDLPNTLERLARLHTTAASICRLVATCPPSAEAWRVLGRLSAQSDRFAQALLDRAARLGGGDALMGYGPIRGLPRPAGPVRGDTAAMLRLQHERVLAAYDQVANDPLDHETRVLLAQQRAGLEACRSDWLSAASTVRAA